MGTKGSDEDPMVRLPDARHVRGSEVEPKLEPVREARRELQTLYTEMFESLSDVLIGHDPIGILFDENHGEYDPEVGTILPRLREAHSEEDVRSIVHEEFVRWFSDSAGSVDKYSDIARDVWALWTGPRGDRFRAAVQGEETLPDG